MNLWPPLKQTSVGTPRDLSGFLNMESQGFGERPEYYGPRYGLKGHNGLDWPCPIGTPVHAAHSGIIVGITDDANAGKGVVLLADDGSCKSIYWHFDSIGVTMGQHVAAGEQVGLSGNTGDSTGPHLHFGIKPLDANGQVRDRDNGYDGAVDPTPYLTWYEPQSHMLELARDPKLGSKVFVLIESPTKKRLWIPNPEVLEIGHDAGLWGGFEAVVSKDLSAYAEGVIQISVSQ